MKQATSLRLSITTLLLLAVAAPGLTVASAVNRDLQTNAAFSSWSRDADFGGFVYYEDNGAVACRPATEEETQKMTERDAAMPLAIIVGGGFRTQAAGVLNITLRGTPQLDAFPQAKAAFIRAAAIWTALVKADITIVIDVDFGPTRFGDPFPQGVLGSAESQQLGNNNGYTDVRNSLIAGAGGAEELGLYNSLPQTSVPTDIGNTTGLFAPSAALRALRLIDPVADPNREQAQFGSPPSIGFNSGFPFDFDPSNGVDPGLVDFETVAVHEIGHVLGFTSLTGAKELRPTMDVSLSLWDIFRFRPGVAVAAAAAAAPATFGTSQRVLSSGGEQVFFAGAGELSLSTGRPDGTGGDGFQAGHWKNDSLIGNTIGVMDPDIAPGQRQPITDSDLRVLNAIGFGAEQADPGAASLKKVTYNGSKLTIKGSGFAGQLQLSVNFVVVAPPLSISGSAKKLKIKGRQSELNLVSGANLVQVIKDGLRSNIIMLNL